MTDTGPKRIGVSIEVKPHVYDPAVNPELFDGVLSRRVVAFFVDLIVITLPILFATIFIFLFGLVTLGLGWALYWLLSPFAVIWALIYYGSTIGGPRSATLGMRMMDLEVRTWYGDRAYFLLGAVHAVLYWVSVSTLTPFILLVGFFNPRRRMLHDLLAGVVVVNRRARLARDTVGAP